MFRDLILDILRTYRVVLLITICFLAQDNCSVRFTVMSYLNEFFFGLGACILRKQRPEGRRMAFSYRIKLIKYKFINTEGAALGYDCPIRKMRSSCTKPKKTLNAFTLSLIVVISWGSSPEYPHPVDVDFHTALFQEVLLFQFYDFCSPTELEIKRRLINGQ